MEFQYKPLEKLQERQFDDIQLSKKVIISDPCYGRGTWCAGSLDNVKEGTYKTYLAYSDEGDWGNRVAELMVVHEDFDGKQDYFDWKNTGIDVGVDSGQAGIFSDDIYPQSKEDQGEYGDRGSFYGEACAATMKNYDELLRWYKLDDQLKKASSEENREFTESEIMLLKEKIEGCKEFVKSPKDFTEKRIEILNADRLENKLPAYTKEEIMRLKGVINFVYGSDPEIYIQKLNILEGKFELPEKPDYPQGGTVMGRGFVSSSGYGDGSYDCLVAHNKEGEIIAMKLVYLSDWEDEDDDYEDEEE